MLPNLVAVKARRTLKNSWTIWTAEIDFRFGIEPLPVTLQAEVEEETLFPCAAARQGPRCRSSGWFKFVRNLEVFAAGLLLHEDVVDVERMIFFFNLVLIFQVRLEGVLGHEIFGTDEALQLTFHSHFIGERARHDEGQFFADLVQQQLAQNLIFVLKAKPFILIQATWI